MLFFLVDFCVYRFLKTIFYFYSYNMENHSIVFLNKTLWWTEILSVKKYTL